MRRHKKQLGFAGRAAAMVDQILFRLRGWDRRLTMLLALQRHRMSFRNDPAFPQTVKQARLVMKFGEPVY